jgi:hypothetical protein
VRPYESCSAVLLICEHAVVEDDDDHADAVARRGLQLLEHEAERAVAGEAQHLLVRRGQLRADAGGQRPADCPRSRARR